MTVEPGKPTETVPVEGEPSGAGAAAQPEAVETPEAKRIRELEEETARLKEANEAQRGQLRAWQPKVEAMNALQQSGSPGADATASPTGMAGGGSLEQQLAALKIEFDQYGLTSTAIEIQRLEAEMRDRRGEDNFQRFRGAAKQVFDALADREIAAVALAVFDERNTRDPQVCIDAARSRVAAAKAASKQPTPKTVPPADTTGRPDTAFAGADAGAGGPKKMPESAYDAAIAAGGPSALKLKRDLESGAVVLEYGR